MQPLSLTQDDTERVKDMILRNAYRLKYLNTQQCDIIKGVILSHDINEEERLIDKQLWEEAKCRNKSKTNQELGNSLVVGGRRPVELAPAEEGQRYRRIPG